MPQNPCAATPRVLLTHRSWQGPKIHRVHPRACSSLTSVSLGCSKEPAGSAHLSQQEYPRVEKRQEGKGQAGLRSLLPSGAVKTEQPIQHGGRRALRSWGKWRTKPSPALTSHHSQEGIFVHFPSLSNLLFMPSPVSRGCRNLSRSIHGLWDPSISIPSGSQRNGAF